MMTLVYNRSTQRSVRKQLRHHIPESEIILWAALKGKKLEGVKFRRQYSVGRYVVDFYCPQLKLAIEIDGDSHFTEEAEHYDQKRTAYIESIGITVTRFTNLDVKQNLDSVIAQVQQEIQALSR